MELQFVFSAHRLIIMAYICIKFLEKFLEWFKSYGADTISILIITKEHNSVNNVLRVLVFCTFPYRGQHLYQVW